MQIDHGVVASQGAVASRAQLNTWGVDRWRIRDQVRARRWALHGRQTVAFHTGPLDETAHRWRAFWEAGSAAALDGASSLAAAGLEGYRVPATVISLPAGRRRKPITGVRIQYVAKRLDDELIVAGVPRTRPEVASLRAACWASSDRQAALALVMPAQQRIVAPSRLLIAVDRVALHWRPAFIRVVVDLVARGAQALSELDFAGLCRAYELPEPDRQVIRQGRGGRYYLDAGWTKLGLFVEVDGVHHFLGLTPIEDALRQNEIHMAGDTVLRLPALGLQTHEAELMMQVVRAYEAHVARAA